MYLCSALLTFTQGQLMTVTTQRISQGLREAISKKINRLPIDYYNKTTLAIFSPASPTTSDTISQTIQNSIITLVSSVVLLLGCLLMMFKTNWIMTISAIVASLIGFVLMVLIMGRSQRYFIARQAGVGRHERPHRGSIRRSYRHPGEQRGTGIFRKV